MNANALAAFLIEVYAGPLAYLSGLFVAFNAVMILANRVYSVISNRS